MHFALYLIDEQAHYYKDTDDKSAPMNQVFNLLETSQKKAKEATTPVPDTLPNEDACDFEILCADGELILANVGIMMTRLLSSKD